MALDANIRGATSGTGAEVGTGGYLKIAPELDTVNNQANIGGVRVFFENDAGQGTGTPYLMAPEVDDDFRLRVSNDIILDEEDMTYTTQNFTKHRMDATTYVPTWTATGFNTNPSSLNTAAAATVLRTYKTFTVEGTETLALDVEVSWSYASGSSIPVNSVFETGFGLLSTTTPFDCFDGVYFRLSSAGVYGVIRNNSGTDTQISNVVNDWTGTNTPWVPVSGRKYQIIIYLMTRTVEFWICDPVNDMTWLAVEMNTPPGYGSPIASPATQVFFRQSQPTAPTIASSMQVARYNVRRGGTNISTTLNVLASRAGESSLSWGTLTTTANQAIGTGSITRPTAAAPSNTAALVTSLSAIVLETPTGAAGTDTILMAYQCPALPTATGATYAQNRRLRIDGVNIASAVQTVFAGGPIAKHFYLAYGSTSVSLAGVAADTVTTKAYRRVQLPIAQAYGATAAAGTLPTGDYSKQVTFQTPIFINPGEFVALVCHNLIGTAVTTGTIQHAISFDYSWE